METQTSAHSRYEQLSIVRQPYLHRARGAAELTIPALIPPEAHSGSSPLPEPYQSTGAEGVNNLGAKLLLALFPPNQPFFRLPVPEHIVEELEATAVKALRTEIEEAMGTIERRVQADFEASAIRISASEALKHLIVAGNVLLYMLPDGTLRVFQLPNYVVKRDPAGNVLEILTKEVLAPTVLPENVRKAWASSKTEGDLKSVDLTVNLYTWIRRKGNRFLIHQEVDGIEIPDSKGSYPADETPWMALRWTKVSGQDYGRGLVEEYIGDIRALDGLSRAILEGSAAAARGLILVNPNGVITERSIQDAPNWAVRAGTKEDVSVLQLEKYADFRVALENIDRIERRLSRAFLLTSSISRDAERVTAEEIRLMASELEDTLGGVYSVLAQEFQLPLVKRKLVQMRRSGKLPPLPPGVKPTVVAGMEALGRGHDLQRLNTFADIMQRTLGPQGFLEVINTDDFAKRIGVGLGLDMKGLVRSQEELAQARSATFQQQMQLKTAGQDVQAGVKMAEMQMKAEADGEASGRETARKRTGSRG